MEDAPPELQMTLHYLESFTFEADPFQHLPADIGYPYFIDGGYGLYVGPGAPDLIVTAETYADLVFQVSARTEGDAVLTLRRSDAGSYRFILAADGRAVVMRGETLLGEGSANPSASTGRLLQASILGGMLRFGIDGNEVLTVLDADPLPPGRAAARLPTGGILDDLAISIPTTGSPAFAALRPTYSSDPFFPSDPAIRAAIFHAESTSRDAIYYLLGPTVEIRAVTLEGFFIWATQSADREGSLLYNSLVQLSPDGKYLLAPCSSAGAQICVMDERGRVRTLTSGTAWKGEPSWYASSTGLEVVYATIESTPGAQYELRTVTFDPAIFTTVLPLPSPRSTAATCRSPRVVPDLANHFGGAPIILCTRVRNYTLGSFTYQNGYDGVGLVEPLSGTSAAVQNPYAADSRGVRLIDAGGPYMAFERLNYTSYGLPNFNIVARLDTTGETPAAADGVAYTASPDAPSIHFWAMSDDGIWVAYDDEPSDCFTGTCDLFASNHHAQPGQAQTYRLNSASLPLYPPSFDWGRFRLPAPELSLSLTLNDAALDPNALHIGQSIPIRARITNTGDADAAGPITLRVTVPRGLTTAEVRFQEDARAILNSILQLLADLLGFELPAFSDGSLFAAAADTQQTTLTFTYNGAPIPPGSSASVDLDLVVRADQVGVFTLTGEALLTDTPGSLATPMAQFSPQAGVPSAWEAALTIIVQTPYDPVRTAHCMVTIASSDGVYVNIRSRPYPDASVYASIPPGLAAKAHGKSYHSDWYLVTIDAYQVTGWVAGAVLNLTDCASGMPLLDDDGNVLPPTPTPMPPTPTPEPDPDLCVGRSTETDWTNIRDFPRPDLTGGVSITTRGVEIGSFGSFGLSSYDVQVIGRFNSGTDRTWDDWYRVSYTDRSSGEVMTGWAAAQYTTLQPSYLDARCAINTFIYDSEHDQMVDIGSSFVYPLTPSPNPAAVSFYATAKSVEYRLPAPFVRVPVADGAVFTSSQGYGANSFAYRHPHYYEGSNHLHSGLDFLGRDEQSPATCSPDAFGARNRCIRVVPICDGIVWRETPTTGPNTGQGLVIRCFSSEGSMSNTYLSYNHLEDVGDQRQGALVLNGTEIGLNTYQYAGNDTPHLHLEVLLDLDGNIDNAVRVNPLLLFEEHAADYITALMDAYYPDTSTVQGNESRFEWAPVDRIDPVVVLVQPIDVVAFNNGNFGIPPGRSGTDEDLDLGIEIQDNHPFSIFGDRRDLAQEVCTVFWGRTDLQFLFRYSSAQNCVTTGHQDVPQDGSGDNGVEWLQQRWITGVIALANTLRDHDK